MLRNFFHFDSALIERLFQPAADMMFSRIGLQPVRLAHICVDIASVAWILSQAGSLSTALAHWQVGAAALHLAMLLLGLLAMCSLHTLLRRVMARPGPSPLRSAMLPHRAMLLAMLAARLLDLRGFAAVADLVMLSFAACALYLGACVSRPPARQRSKWLAASGAG